MSNGTSARKFIANDDLKNIAQTLKSSNKSNDDYLIDKSVVLNDLSAIVNKAAELAKVSLENIKLANQSIDTIDDNGNNNKFVSQNDLESFSTNFSNDILSSMKNVSLEQKNRLSGIVPKIVKEKINKIIQEKNSNTQHSAVLDSPEIDHITVEMDKRKGVIDCFYSKLTFSLPIDKIVSVSGEPSVIRGIRIFRSEEILKTDRPKTTLSSFAVEKLKTNKASIRSRNEEKISFLEKKLNEVGVQNSISNLTPFDSFKNSRISSEDVEINLNSSNSAGLVGNEKTDTSNFINGDISLDKSVSEDLNTLRIIQLSNRIIPKIYNSAVVGKKYFIDSDGVGLEHAKQIQRINEKQNLLNIYENNWNEFKEIGFVTPSQPGNSENSRSRQIGDLIEYSFEDESILFSRSYRYYISIIDKNMRESPRSRIVQINIDGMRIPENPKSVVAQVKNKTIVLTIVVGDQLVEKFEIYRKDVDNFFKNKTGTTNVLSDKNGYSSNSQSTDLQKNGFMQIGEALNMPTNSGGASFVDKKIKSGRKYLYRVYSVDIFGNKSESPKELSVFAIDELKINELSRISIEAEVDAASNKIKLTFDSFDKNIVGFYLTRRDFTIGQSGYSAPGDINRTKFGNSKHSFSNTLFDGEILRGKEHLWNGFFKRVKDSVSVFFDKTVQTDHYYQYKIQGIDKFGNLTTTEFSRKLFVSRKPLILPPINFNAELFTDSGIFKGARLSWDDSNIDISAEDSIGNQTTLEETSVRTLYQLERQKNGNGQWDKFPLIKEREFIDLIEEYAPLEFSPNRPSFVERGESYSYRVQAFQTGTFISNFTPTIEVFADSPPIPPINFKLTTPSTKIKPFFIMLNWDTSKESGIIDKWEVERSVINNFAASKLTFGKDIESIQFSEFRKIYRESSRFKSKVNDSNDKIIDSSLITGEHYFMDSQISFGNTYYYRIRAVTVKDTFSNWIYKAITIADQSFENKQNFLLTNEEKTMLADSIVPLNFKSNLLSDSIEKNISSFSLLPNFSKPNISLNLPILTSSINKTLSTISTLTSLSTIPTLTSLSTIPTLTSLSTTTLNSTIAFKPILSSSINVFKKTINILK